VLVLVGGWRGERRIWFEWIRICLNDDFIPGVM
jgi:hypothetical protein